jgi:hypothetical protein
VKSNPKTFELNLAVDLTEVPLSAEHMDLGYETDWHKFSKLESMDRPGLTEVEFFGLFEVFTLPHVFRAECVESESVRTEL